MKYDAFQMPTAPPNPGRTVLLMGKSKSGPINSPVYIKNMKEAEAIFGDKEYGDLVRAFDHASRNSDITIYLMRVTGEYARGSLLGIVDNTEQPVVKFRSIYGGDDFNYISYRVQDVTVNDGSVQTALVFENPNGINVAYPLSEFATLQELVTAINVATRQGEGLLVASTAYPQLSTDTLLTLNDESRLLIGGSDGLDVTKDELYMALDVSYEILEGFEVDIVHPVSARFNDTYPGYFYGKDASYGQAVYGDYADGDFLKLIDTENDNRPVTFHEQLITFCRRQEQSGIMTHGIIGLRRISNMKALSREGSYLIQLLDTTAFRTRYGLVDQIFGQIYDKGHYVTVFGSEFTFDEGTENEYIENGAALYAGFVAAIPAGTTTTNQSLPEGITLRHEFSGSEIRELAVMGVTVARNSVRKGLVIANGVTAALFESELHFIGNVRMVQHALNAVNAAVDDLIGEPFSQTVIGKELHRRLTNVINHLKTQGILKDASFQVEFSRRTSTGKVSLDLLPKHAIEFIATDAMLQFNGRGGA